MIAGETASETEIFAIDNITSDDLLVFTPNSKSRKALNLMYKFDSKGELEFAKHLDIDDNVLLYTKLKKGGFVIETPAGNYSPDWAIVYRKGNDQLCMCFIAETKWDKEEGDLRDEEKIKITCAKKHFEAVNKAFAETIKYAWINSYNDATREASFPQAFDK